MAERIIAWRAHERRGSAGGARRIGDKMLESLRDQVTHMTAPGQAVPAGACRRGLVGGRGRGDSGPGAVCTARAVRLGSGDRRARAAPAPAAGDGAGHRDGRRRRRSRGVAPSRSRSPRARRSRPWQWTEVAPSRSRHGSSARSSGARPPVSSPTTPSLRWWRQARANGRSSCLSRSASCPTTSIASICSTSARSSSREARHARPTRASVRW